MKSHKERCTTRQRDMIGKNLGGNYFHLDPCSVANQEEAKSTAGMSQTFRKGLVQLLAMKTENL